MHYIQRALYSIAISASFSQVHAAGTQPIGNLEQINNGVISGWACDKDEASKSISVHFYANHTYDGGTFLGGVIANLTSEPVINAACGGGLAHRFEFKVPRSEKSKVGPGLHEVYAFAIDSQGGVNPMLANSPKILSVTGVKKYLNQHPKIGTNCRYYHDQDWKRIPIPQGICTNSLAGYFIRGTNEDSGFGNARYFLPKDKILNGTPYQAASRPYWFYEMHEKGDGTYQVGWVVDKINYPADLDNYSGAFFNDNGFHTLPDVSENIFLDIRAGLFANEQVSDAQVGPSKNRTTIGWVSNWADPQGSRHDAFVEVNLFKTQNFDLCTYSNLGGSTPSNNCDPTGIYDRRSYYGQGEVVYYDINTLHKTAGPRQNELQEAGGMRNFTIPIAALTRKYPWVRPPHSWIGVKIGGIYIGHEVWGRGRIWTEFDNYGVYSFTAD